MLAYQDIVIRLLLAAVFGGIVGAEREWRDKAAGFRTNILICLGSALIMIISITLSEDYESYMMDPARIAAQIVSGIGFLGAGAIIRDRFGIKGITTAATIWLTAGMGMAIGAGKYFPAAITLAFTIFALQALIPFEKLLRNKNTNKIYHIRYKSSKDISDLISNYYHSAQMIIRDIDFEVLEDEITVKFGIKHSDGRHKEFLKKLEESDKIIDLIKF